MRVTVGQNIGAGLVGLALVLGCIACADSSREIKKGNVSEPPKVPPGQSRPAAPVPPPPPVERKAPAVRKPTRFFHRVKWPGETLSLISKWYTGKQIHWKALAKANPRVKAHRIFVGDEIFVPAYLLKTREPMPRSFLARHPSRPKKIPSPPKKEEEFELFGPKRYPEE